MENINKIWGQRRRILLNDLVEIDYLTIKKDHFCSIHHHKHKSNKFFVIDGRIKIKSELGDVILGANQEFTVHPPYTHQYIALTDVLMIEIAFVAIDENDIERAKQGGRIDKDGKHITENELKERGELEI